MAVLIKDLSIKNFKSIKELDLKCKRINLFIGKPNAGKSNILEALSLYSGCYELNHNKFLSSFIRFDTLNDLFHYKDLDNAIEVVTDLGFVTLRHYQGENDFIYSIGDDIQHFHKRIWLDGAFEDYIYAIYRELGADSKVFPTILFLSSSSIINESNNLKRKTPWGSYLPVQKYHFDHIPKINRENASSLIYDGSNLYTILSMYKELADYAAQFFEEYGLDYVKVQSEKTMVIQRKTGGVVDQLGFELTPDTFQRLIYHVAAIKSNRNSVLLFEEPESHSFPPYIQEFANQVIDSEANQFFITTHSPYLLNTFLQNKFISKDLNIVLTWFEDFQTKAKVLSKKEIDQIYGNGIDIFFNIDNYIGK
jgi:hypothetical protein